MTLESKMINVAGDFNPLPAGRYRQDGDFSGEAFREDVLVPALKEAEHVTVDFNGTFALGSSFLEEAFGGLVRVGYFTSAELERRLTIKGVLNSYITEIWQHIKNAKNKAK